MSKTRPSVDLFDGTLLVTSPHFFSLWEGFAQKSQQSESSSKPDRKLILDGHRQSSPLEGVIMSSRSGYNCVNCFNKILIPKLPERATKNNFRSSSLKHHKLAIIFGGFGSTLSGFGGDCLRLSSSPLLLMLWRLGIQTMIMLFDYVAFWEDNPGWLRWSFLRETFPQHSNRFRNIQGLVIVRRLTSMMSEIWFCCCFW